MPTIDKIARFTPVKPGFGKFCLLGFKAANLIQNYRNGINLIVVLRNDNRLADWSSNSPDGFITVTPSNCRQAALDFEFDVGPEVINPMAFDNSGNYIIKVRDDQGVIHSFAVAMQGVPRPAGGVGPGIATNFNPNQGSAARPNGPMNNGMNGPNGPMNMGMNGPNGPMNNGMNGPNGPMNNGMNGPNGPMNNGMNGPNGPMNMGQNRADAYREQVAQQTQAMQQHTNTSRGVIKIISIICVLLLLVGAFFFIKNLMSSSSVSVDIETKQEQPTDEEKQDEQQQDEAKDENVTEQSDNQATPQPQVLNAPHVEKAMNMKVLSNSSIKNCQINNRPTSEDKAILKECLLSQPSNEELHGLLREALQTGHCEIANRLLSTQARSGSNSSYYAYAMSLYADPNSPLSSPCIAKEKKNADYWSKRLEADTKFNQQDAKVVVDELFQEAK